jgi:anti-sigma factor RsiW
MTMRCRKAKKSISLGMDGRLAPDAEARLQEHLRDCPACLEWRREQEGLLDLVRASLPSQPAPLAAGAFRRRLLERIQGAPSKPGPFVPGMAFLRPALLRAAVLLLLAFSTLLGFFLGGRPEATGNEADEAVVGRTMNLGAFEDLPDGSFGAVYGRMLQEDLR